MSQDGPVLASFEQLNLSPSILEALKSLKFEQPTPIQAQAIPAVLSGRDVLGQAQTGTGKTAAFALPLLDQIDIEKKYPQVLILAPTRELVSQICEAIDTFAQNLPGIKTAAIYGGQSYRDQLRKLKFGVHIVVGAPGRVMDHINRQTLDLAKLNTIVLDEADEMLRMGFVDDVKWICEHAPENCQKLLFSATMPKEIKHIVQEHLKNPINIKVAGQTTLKNINQSYWMVNGAHKLDALSRILEVQETAGIIIFVRTKTATQEVADNLNQRGFKAQALNGDMPQEAREKTVELLKQGKLDIIVATDVAARGLDVERINHVINFDAPFNPEVYVHRIGRTGRAGRTGHAILFVSPRERGLLRAIERTTKQTIEKLELPTVEEITKIRVEKFKEKIGFALKNKNLDFYKKIIVEYQKEHELDPLNLATALVKMAQENQPLIIEKSSHPKSFSENASFRGDRRDRGDRSERGDRRERGDRSERGDRRERGDRSERGDRRERGDRNERRGSERRDNHDNSRFKAQRNFTSFRIEVGTKHGARAGSILGAIANEADLDRDFIGNINIYKDYSTVDLPNNLPKQVMNIIGKARVAGRPLQISEYNE